MTAEQKAKDLVEKMYVTYEPKIEDKGGIYYFNMSFDIAKQSALVAVDEMLYWTNEQDTLIWLNDFYSEVKQEIEKL